MNLDSLTAYLVEDEPLCRADFRQILRGFPSLRLVGEAGTLAAAKNFLLRKKVDLLFLDLSVGRENGFDLLGHLPHPPMVIALTAHPQHAARGFSLNLVDYILKPVEKERLQAAIDKAWHRKIAAPLKPGRITFLAEIDGTKTSLDLWEILGAEAMGNYVRLHTTRGHAVKRSTFKQLRSKLPSSLYLETGRGRMVARRMVKSWQRGLVGKLELILEDQTKVRVSERRVTMVLKALEPETSS